MNPILTIAVLAYNQRKLTEGCLNSLEGQEVLGETKVMLIDNGSIPGTYHSSPNFIRFEKNSGNIGGQNACFQCSNSESVLFIANDVRLLPGCIKHILLFAQELDRGSVPWGQIQPILLTDQLDSVDNMGLKYWWPGYGISVKTSNGVNLDAVTSTCYLMRKSVWNQMGGFDESLESSHEDIDMGLKLKTAGYRLFYCPGAFAIHLGNATLKHTIKDPKQTFQRARLKTVRKHFRGIDRWVRLAAIHTIGAITHAIPVRRNEQSGQYNTQVQDSKQ